MKRIILKLTSLALICAVVVLSLDFLFTSYDGRYTYRMLQEMYNSEENINTVFLGSSHCFSSIDPVVIDDALDCYSFNAGSSVQGMSTSYHMLLEIMKYHKPKTVFLDTNQAVMHIRTNDASVFYVTDFMKNTENKYELLKAGGTETVLNGYISFRRNFKNINFIANIKSRFTPVSDYSSVTYDTAEYRGRGFVYNHLCEEITQEDIDKLSNDFNSHKNVAGKSYEEYLAKIIECCRDNDIELILIEHPSCTAFINGFPEYEQCIAYFTDVAEKNNLQYWNFNLYKYDIGIDDINDFENITHLNGKGAEKYTKALAEVARQYKQGRDVSDMFNKEL